MAYELHDSAQLVLETLTWDLRIATVEQLQQILNARLRRPTSARSVIRQLHRKGFAETVWSVVALPEITSPLLAWAPPLPAPSFGSLAWILEERWARVRPQRISLCWATRRAALHTAGVACFQRRASQVEHDLGTAAVYTHLWQSRGLLHCEWVGEDILRRDYASSSRWLTKIPDAALFSDGEVQRVIEFCGQYSIKRLRRFHAHCQKHRLAYQLW